MALEVQLLLLAPAAPAAACRWLSASGRPAESLLSFLQSYWAQGTPGAAATAATAAAGFAAGGHLGEGQLGGLLREMNRLIRKPR
jgi:hypothetical protein